MLDYFCCNIYCFLTWRKDLFLTSNAKKSVFFKLLENKCIHFLAQRHVCKYSALPAHLSCSALISLAKISYLYKNVFNVHNNCRDKQGI